MAEAYRPGPPPTSLPVRYDQEQPCPECNLILTSWWAGSSAELLEPAQSLANVPNSDENPQGYNPCFCSSAALTAAKLYPGLKGLAWASWSPVIQRCSQPCSFSADFFLKCVSKTSKQPPQHKATLINTSAALLSAANQERVSLIQTVRPQKNTRVPEMEPHLPFLKMTSPTTRPVVTGSKCLHVCFCGVNAMFYSR